MSQKTTPNVWQTENNTVDKNDIRYLIIDGDTRLKRIKPHIQGLYYWGDIGLLTKKTLGIVGPRKSTIYGQKVMQYLFSILQRYDIVTISGGALGIDILVHEYSLERGIPTIVVLGGSIERYKHTGKYHFLQHIVDSGGLVISEYSGNMSPKKYTFPQRNRIIAGLSDVLFVPEASIGSGSLITVDKAIEYNIPIYAPMQDIFSVSGMGIAEYIVQGKVKPIDRHISLLLDIYFGKKPGENQLPTVSGIDTMGCIDGYVTSNSVQEDLIGESIKELGIV